MNILITGAAGFLGFHLTDHFYKKGFNLTLLDIADYDSKDYPNNAVNTNGLNYVKGDVRDKSLVEKIIPGVDIVIHAAAALPLSSSKEIFDTNVNGTENVLDLSQKYGVKHFIFISSTAVYGIPKVHPIYEEAPLVGVGAYGQSKIDAEKHCAKYRSKGLVTTVVRPKTFIGTHRLGVFEILYDWIKDGKKIPVIGNGKNKYQLLDVEDLVELLYILATTENKQSVNDSFNIGSENFTTVGEDLGELFKYAKSGSRIMPTPAMPIKKALWLFEKLGLSPLYQWIYDTADKDSFVSTEKLIKRIGFHTKYSNSQALIKSYQWYLDNYTAVKARPSGVTHTVGWKQGILGMFKKFL